VSNRSNDYSATLAERRAERAKLLALASAEREKARALRLRGGATAKAKALEHIAKAKRLESDAYRLRLRKGYTGGPRKKKSAKKGVGGWLARLGGGE